MPATATPPLENGDRLLRAEFERRYTAMRHPKKAELIEGVVHIPLRQGIDVLAEARMDMLGCVVYYRAFTPGVAGGAHGTVRLDFDNEPQPDCFLRIREEYGGQSAVEGLRIPAVSLAPPTVRENGGRCPPYESHASSSSEDGPPCGTASPRRPCVS